MTEIRPIKDGDWDAVWQIIEPAFRAGETYAFSPDITESQAYQAWIETPSATFVALDDDGAILGTFYIKPNQPGLGAHVCNCGYIVAACARGRGIASAMCEHSQREAVALGIRAMQYNLVVSTNEGAVRLRSPEWRRSVPISWVHLNLGAVWSRAGDGPVAVRITKKVLDRPRHVLAPNSSVHPY